MKQPVMIGLVLVIGLVVGTFISPLLAQSQTIDAQRTTCFIGESSSAACSGKWIIFAGNSDDIDSGAWIVRVNSETGEIWYKDGKRLKLLEDEK